MAISRDNTLVFPVPLANGSYTYRLGPGMWSVQLFFRGTGVDVQVFPLGITGVAMGAYTCALMGLTVIQADPVQTAISMTTGRVLRATSVGSSNGLALQETVVPVIQDIRITLTNISSASEITLIAIRRAV